MTILRRRSVPKPRPARETHDSIRNQTDAYLKRGGSITEIPAGFTGITAIEGPEQRIRNRLRNKRISNILSH